MMNQKIFVTKVTTVQLTNIWFIDQLREKESVRGERREEERERKKLRRVTPLFA